MVLGGDKLIALEQRGEARDVPKPATSAASLESLVAVSSAHHSQQLTAGRCPYLARHTGQLEGV